MPAAATTRVVQGSTSLGATSYARPATTISAGSTVARTLPATTLPLQRGYAAASPVVAPRTTTLAATSLTAPLATSLPISSPVTTRVIGQPATTFASMTSSALQVASVPFVQAKPETPWGGGCPWQSDKTAFKQFVKTAIDVPSSKARKELYGFLAECFMDADSDRDGHVGMSEFDFLIERAAALPRRFGMAPSWVEMYGDVNHRNEERLKMFEQMAQGNNVIGLEQWVAFSIQHITEKSNAMEMGTLDFGHLAGVGGDAFVDYCEKALSSSHSEEYKSLYEHLFKVFVESDVEEAGVVHWQNFDVLIEDAAKAPRDAGLAPPTAEAYQNEAQKVAARKAEWDAMDTNASGAITFEQFLAWALTHINGKVQDYRAGKPYVKTAVACPITAQIGTCPVTMTAAPVTMAAAPVTMMSRPAAPVTMMSRPASVVAGSVSAANII